MLEENKTVEVALFFNGYGVVVAELGGYLDSQYPRVSYKVEVTFVPLPIEEQLKNQISKLDSELEDIKQTALEKMTKIEEKKKELLALTYTVGEEDGTAT